MKNYLTQLLGSMSIKSAALLCLATSLSFVTGCKSRSTGSSLQSFTANSPDNIFVVTVGGRDSCNQFLTGMRSFKSSMKMVENFRADSKKDVDYMHICLGSGGGGGPEGIPIKFAAYRYKYIDYKSDSNMEIVERDSKGRPLDVRGIVDYVTGRAAGRRVILVGHSYGGWAALKTAQFNYEYRKRGEAFFDLALLVTLDPISPNDCGALGWITDSPGCKLYPTDSTLQRDKVVAYTGGQWINFYQRQGKLQSDRSGHLDSFEFLECVEWGHRFMGRDEEIWRKVEQFSRAALINNSVSSLSGLLGSPFRIDVNNNNRCKADRDDDNVGKLGTAKDEQGNILVLRPGLYKSDDPRSYHELIIKNESNSTASKFEVNAYPPNQVSMDGKNDIADASMTCAAPNFATCEGNFGKFGDYHIQIISPTEYYSWSEDKKQQTRYCRDGCGGSGNGFIQPEPRPEPAVSFQANVPKPGHYRTRDDGYCTVDLTDRGDSAIEMRFGGPNGCASQSATLRCSGGNCEGSLYQWDGQNWNRTEAYRIRVEGVGNSYQDINDGQTYRLMLP